MTQKNEPTQRSAQKSDKDTISAAHPLHDASIRLDQLPANGRHIVLNAGAEECSAIAERLQVDSVSSFSAKVHAKPIKGGILIEGTLKFDLSQLCVVTFKPVPESVSEEFKRIFLSGTDAKTEVGAGAEVFIDLEGEDLPDYFEGPDVDVTDLLMEVLALSLSDYPRAPGAKLPENAQADDSEETSPFAALEQLKHRGD